MLFPSESLELWYELGRRTLRHERPKATLGTGPLTSFRTRQHCPRIEELACVVWFPLNFAP